MVTTSSLVISTVAEHAGHGGFLISEHWDSVDYHRVEVSLDSIDPEDNILDVPRPKAEVTVFLNRGKVEVSCECGADLDDEDIEVIFE